MKKLALLISIFTLGIVSARAQDIATINPDAATAGMANVTTAVSSTSFSVYGNAAAALFDFKRFDAEFSYMPWNGGGAKGNFYSVGSYFSLDEKNTLEAGTRIYKMPGTTGNRQLEASADVAYARLVHNCAGVAVTAHYFHGSHINGLNYNALSFDIATYAQIPTERMAAGSWVAVGAKIADIGFALGNSDCKLPSRASAGAAIYAPIGDSHSLTGSVDLGYRFAPKGTGSFGASVGAEYILMNLLSLRAGYHVADKYGLNYGTVGAGIKFLMLHVDFAYTIAEKNTPLHNLYTISAGIYF